MRDPLPRDGQSDRKVRNALTRRQLFRKTGLGLGAAVLAGLLHDDTMAGKAELGQTAARMPHAVPRAKRVIYLHMIGAPSQLDLFDPKPELLKRDGQPCPPELLKGRRFAFIGGNQLTLAGSRYTFARHGQSGAQISE